MKNYSDLTPEAIRRNRAELIGIIRALDVKGKCSGKHCVFSHSKAQDLLGYFFIQRGYSPAGRHDVLIDNQTRCAYSLFNKMMGCASATEITIEIDRDDSTNASILAKIQEIFAANPV